LLELRLSSAVAQVASASPPAEGRGHGDRASERRRRKKKEEEEEEEEEEEIRNDHY